jgi:hypothetical protein
VQKWLIPLRNVASVGMQPDEVKVSGSEKVHSERSRHS